MKFKEPQKPFPTFKWKWASVQCTEGINDPLVLLGVLFRMAKLEGKYKYSSPEFANELIGLSNDLKGTGVNVDLQRRTGERNIIRNSGQYWKALNLIPQNTHGLISLTDFGRKVANHEISQTEFSALSIINYHLPNPMIQSKEECEKWAKAGLKLQPLKLILQIIRALGGSIGSTEAYMTVEELIKIVIPLSGTPKRELGSYVDYIRAYREGNLDISKWNDYTTDANDKRISREFLLFLCNYGYLSRPIDCHIINYKEKYIYNYNIDAEITEILAQQSSVSNEIVENTERKLVKGQYRPNQARFRKEVLKAHNKCVITNVEMPEVLEAAHIVPYRYHGKDTVENGFAMRMDIHYLFDAGHLRISADGKVFLSEKARWSYGSSIPPRIFIPEHVNRKYLQWRWDNYNGV